MLAYFWLVIGIALMLIGLAFFVGAALLFRSAPIDLRAASAPLDNVSLIQALSRTKRGTVYRSTITNRSARR